MLRGERVWLRALEPGDAQALHRWHLDHELSVLDGVLYPTTLGEWEEFVAKAPAVSFGDVVLGAGTDADGLIGYVSLRRTRPEDRSSEFGIALAREHWQQSYGRDDTLTLLRFAFREMNLHRVSLTVTDYNDRARGMYEACGFREEGRLREAKFRAGRYCDNVVMGILDREFQEIDSAS
jgi:RimJ/RimL family protein N-acetyltransferase